MKIRGIVSTVAESTGPAIVAIAEPTVSIVRIGRRLMDTSPSWSEVAVLWIRLLLQLMVWSVVGGVITRLSAMQFAREHGTGFGAAISFTTQRFFTLISAALTPTAGVAVLWGMCAVAGFVGRIPWVGEAVLGLLWIIPLIFGLLMAIILVGGAIGWPLMHAAVSVEDADGLEAASRSFNLVFSRPWYFLWLVGLAAVFGAVLVLLLYWLSQMVVQLSFSAVGWGMGHDAVAGLLQFAPEQFSHATGDVDAVHAGPGSVLAGGFWLNGFACLVNSFAISFFWTASTIVFLLVRLEEDAIEIDEVHLTEDEANDDGFPVVGVAASDQPIIERPVRPPEGAEPGPGDSREPHVE